MLALPAPSATLGPVVGDHSERWTLLTSHGCVLFYLASEPDATVRQITDAIGISERRVATILRDLEAAGMMRSTRVGNRKHYEVDPSAHFRHPTLSHVPLSDVLGKLRPRAAPTPIRWRR